MKETTKPLRIFQLSHPLMETEILALLGDKFSSALSFPWEITDNYESCDVILWDGVLTIKNEEFFSQLLKDINSTKVLLLLGEAVTLFKDHPFVKFPDLSQLKIIEFPGWNVLPEDLLRAIESCERELNNV